jgi:hypothetical protein
MIAQWLKHFYFSLLAFPYMMALTMLVAVRGKRPLMQLVRLMQNPLMIALPTTSMNPAKSLYPLGLPRRTPWAVSVPRMIGRLFHTRSPLRRRLHPPLTVPTMPLIRRLPLPVVKTTPVLSTTTITLPHHITS